MRQDWKIRVQPAEREPFVFRATFVMLNSGEDKGVLDESYLYGEGDLAVFLEDLGAGSSEIWGLLESLQDRRTAEIFIDVSEEAMEVLARRSSRGPESPGLGE